MYSRTKHIKMRHYFIRDQVQNHNVSFEFVPIEEQLANILTKLLLEDKFCEIRRELGVTIRLI